MKNISRSHGFTIMELIGVVIVLAIASVTMIQMQGGLFKFQGRINTVQSSTRVVQECADTVLNVARQDGYTEVTSARFGTALCDTLTAQSGYTIPNVTLAAYTGAACPSGISCQIVTIKEGTSQSPVVLLLVAY